MLHPHRSLVALLVCAAAAGAAVPFVGCESDGQVGPLPAPSGAPVELNLPARVAEHLAFYKTDQGLAVLGPRGWHCLGVVGSGGETLVVLPHPIDRRKFFAQKQGLSGPGIEWRNTWGDTSGRDRVAQLIAHAFPRWAFPEFATEFQRGTYPGDKLIRKSDRVVEPIRGVVMLNGTVPNAVTLAVRLPATQAQLVAAIIRQLEIDGTKLPAN